MNEVVSIVIPAFNVEKYIGECLQSILNQSYRNFEIIVVNDGSTDNTLNEITKFKDIDNRIKIINKKNTGVSDSRNCGIDNAIGEYIVFVDGDDYLADDYISYMLKLIKLYDDDFAFSLNCFTRKNEQQIKKDNIERLSSEEATSLLLSPRVMVGCWNKIYKKGFLDKNKIRFLPQLRYGEGLQFITHTTLSTNKIICGNRKVYYYRRDNPTSVCTKFNINNVYNGELALETIKKHLPSNSLIINTMYDLHYKMYCLGALTKVKSEGLEKEYSYDCKRWLRSIRQNILSFMLKNEIPIYRKLLLFISCIFPNLITKLYIIRKKYIFSNSVQGKK